MLDTFQQAFSLLIQKLIFRSILSLFELNKLIDITLHYLTAIQNTIKRSILFMRIIGYERILIHFIGNLLLTNHNMGNIPYWEHYLSGLIPITFNFNFLKLKLIIKWGLQTPRLIFFIFPSILWGRVLTNFLKTAAALLLVHLLCRSIRLRFWRTHIEPCGEFGHSEVKLCALIKEWNVPAFVLLRRLIKYLLNRKPLIQPALILDNHAIRYQIRHKNILLKNIDIAINIFCLNKLNIRRLPTDTAKTHCKIEVRYVRFILLGLS